jgi:hypothetical protein
MMIKALTVDGGPTGRLGAPVVCTGSGRRWQLAWGSHRVQIENCLGMRYLATLLAKPGREVSAVELATGPGAEAIDIGLVEERARISVGKAIRRALDRITAADPALGHELRMTVHTGLRCCYDPF